MLTPIRTCLLAAAAVGTLAGDLSPLAPAAVLVAQAPASAYAAVDGWLKLPDGQIGRAHV